MSPSVKLLSTASLLVCSAAATAAPTVMDNTISWPDDGWYQVQSASDYSQICAGTRSCTVEPGTYIVINHTSGERFEDVLVGDVSESEPFSLHISGGSISWLDDGWYQVQRADTYESVCNGGTFCSVENGTYIVINHTTGQRYENVEVSGAPENPNEESLIVGNDTIYWLYDGWYQVQTVPGYESVCNGGISCTVEPGTYMVINHTRNTRTEVTVGNDDSAVLSEPMINSENYRGIISSTLQVYTGSHAYTDALFELPYESTVGANPEPGLHDCSEAGSVTIEDYNTTQGDGLSFEFDKCVTGATFVQGTVDTYDFLGAEVVVADSYSENQGGKYGPSLRQSFTGTASRAPGQWSAQSFDYYFYNTFDIDDGDYSWSRVISSGGSFSTAIEGSFSFADVFSATDDKLNVEAIGMSIAFSPEDTQALQGDYEYLDATPFMSIYPEAGTIEITGDDGSRLLMNAATGDMSTVTITIENADESITSLENWSDWSAELRTDTLGATR